MPKKLQKEKRKKVVVALSGGVDSSVSALLLKQKDFDVIGVFMKFWKEGETSENRCCSLESEKRARLVCQKIKIPFYVFNVEREFKKRIVDYFLREHKQGRTPNPCVVCNKEIKFGLLLEKMLKMGGHFLATGHYAKLKKEKVSNDKTKEIYQLWKAKDKNKDQTYFLWQLNQNQLRRIIFPLANYKKTEVIKLAQTFNLPFEEIRESQEICFVRDTVNQFLKRYLKLNLGNIVDKKGNVLAKHEGLWFYTIGQRKGIGLPGGPYYVVGKDLKKNELIVSKDKKDLFSKIVFLKKVNFIEEKPILPLRLRAKIRYNQKEASAILKKNQKGYFLIFQKPQMAPTPGQSAVFYQGQKLLGGGIIC